jgi:hypothetical protein
MQVYVPWIVSGKSGNHQTLLNCPELASILEAAMLNCVLKRASLCGVGASHFSGTWPIIVERVGSTRSSTQSVSQQRFD